MSELSEYIMATVKRGACTCGKCFDAFDNPREHQPTGHTSDVFFFQVAVNPENEPNADVLKGLITKHKGDWCECNPLDGQEHNYMEIGGWIGDQGLALMLMGAMQLVGLGEVLTPNMIPGLPDDLKQQMAGVGMVTFHANTGDAK